MQVEGFLRNPVMGAGWISSDSRNGRLWKSPSPKDCAVAAVQNSAAGVSPALDQWARWALDEAGRLDPIASGRAVTVASEVKPDQADSDEDG
jgi:hypothetical protein